MNLLRTFAFTTFLCLLFATHSAHAQLAVYGTVSGSDFGYQQSGDSADTFNGDYLGVGVGAYYNFVHRAVKVGIDLRDTYTPNSRGGNAGAVSVRLGFVPDVHPCHPYFQIGPGWISEKVPVSATPARTVNTTAVAVGFGLDVRVTPSLDIRAIEIESTVGGSDLNAAATASFSAGIVYHLSHTR
jgi:opacity protein-like surface antigen